MRSAVQAACRKTHWQTVVILTIAFAVTSTADGGQGGSASTAPALQVDPIVNGRRLLEEVQDNVPTFDDAAFYWLCRHVRREADLGVFLIGESERPVPWKLLMDQPDDHRGQLVTVEGILLARPAFVASRPDLVDTGTVYQCELAELGTRSICAVVVVEDPSAIPIRSRVRAKGFFLKVRSYQTRHGEAGAGPLIVARRLESVQSPIGNAANEPSSFSDGSTWPLMGTALLAVLWLAVRRYLRAAPYDGARPLRRSANETGRIGGVGSSNADGPCTEEDFAWLTQMPEEAEEGDGDGPNSRQEDPDPARDEGWHPD